MLGCIMQHNQVEQISAQNIRVKIFTELYNSYQRMSFKNKKGHTTLDTTDPIFSGHNKG